MIRVLILCGLIAGVPLSAGADELSPVDVQLLLDRLEALRNGEKGRRDSRYAVARSAFAAAARAPVRTCDLPVRIQSLEPRRRGSRSGSFVASRDIAL